MSDVATPVLENQASNRKKDGIRRKSKTASVVSGALSGALVSACVQPLDVLRTRMQADSAAGALKSTAETAVSIVKGGGVRALWQGTQPTVFRLGLGAGLHFFFLETLKPLFEKHSSNGQTRMSAAGAALTGGLSRAMAAVVSCPITVVKTRMEYVANSGSPVVHRYQGTFQALKSIAKSEGVAGLYRGLGPTVLSNAPFSALYYTFYTRLQSRLSPDRKPSTAVNFVSGTIAAVAATLITQPADVVRTRVQLGLSSQMVSRFSGTTSANSMITVLRSISKNEGMTGLFAGAAPRILKRTLQTALVWTLYEELMPRMVSLRNYLSNSA